MNILPKKSWHVRNKDNIARVRRDEENAAQEEKERQRRIALAEQEARTDLLRIRAKKRQRNDDTEYEGDSQQLEAYKSGEHINFFKDLEDGKNKSGTNKEYEEEKRLEKEKEEKNIGLLTYLGQSSLESQASKPWYFHPHEERLLPSEKEAGSSRKSEDEWDSKRKRSLDPMLHMAKYVDIKKKQEELKKGKHDKDKERKHKHRHKDKHHDRGGDSASPGSGKKTIEQLRAERLKREKEERLRTERLLAMRKGEKVPGDVDEPVTDDRDRRYNSQFNPDFVRKPRKHKHHDYF